MDTYIQIAQYINQKIRDILPESTPPGIAGQIFNIVTVALTEDCENTDHSNDRQCPLCRQKVVLSDLCSTGSDCDDRFNPPCNCCRYRYDDLDEYPCRWCLNRE